MVSTVSAAVDRAVAAGSLPPAEGEALMGAFQADLAGYTYLSG